MKEETGHWIFVGLWAGLIWTFSSLPDFQSNFSELWDFIVRKIIHAFEFGILALFLFRASCLSRPRRSMGPSLIFAILVSILYAVTDELHQTFVPGRVGSPIDVVIDVMGILFFLIIIRKYDHNGQMFSQKKQARLF